MTDHAFEDEESFDFPEKVEHRAAELREYGLPVGQSIAHAAVSMWTPDEEWDLEDIADEVDRSEETLKNYARRAETQIRMAHRLFVAEFGGQNHILAEQSLWSRMGTRFITTDVTRKSESEYDAAVDGDGRVRLFVVEGGGPSGEQGGHRALSEEVFESLDALADEKYRNNDAADYDELSRWRNLLIEAGVDEDTLESPGAKLPSGHPDSDDHHQYQMRSAEPTEQRGREHGDQY